MVLIIASCAERQQFIWWIVSPLEAARCARVKSKPAKRHRRVLSELVGRIGAWRHIVQGYCLRLMMPLLPSYCVATILQPCPMLRTEWKTATILHCWGYDLPIYVLQMPPLLRLVRPQAGVSRWHFSITTHHCFRGHCFKRLLEKSGLSSPAKIIPEISHMHHIIVQLTMLSTPPPEIVLIINHISPCCDCISWLPSMAPLPFSCRHRPLCTINSSMVLYVLCVFGMICVLTILARGRPDK